MALVSQCDACGQRMPPESAERIGMVLPRDYCTTCAPAIHELQATRDALHTKLSREWTDGLAKIAEAFQRRFPGGQMPDQT